MDPEPLLNGDNHSHANHNTGKKHSHDCHDHGHGANHAKNPMKRLILTAALCFVFMIVEAVGGWLANSLAVMTDAAHMLTDFVGIGIAMASLLIGKKPPSGQHSFGFHRAEIIGAVFSVAIIWGLSIWLVYTAIIRTIFTEEVEGLTMLITAGIGLLCNIFMGKLLHQGHGHDHGHSHGHSHQEDVNVRAAYLHVLGDLLQSIGVTIAGIILYFYPEWRIIDPICTFLFTVIVLFTTIPIFKECISVLMEASPVGIDLDEFDRDLLNIEDVLEVHDLHVWSLSIGKPSMSCHLTSHHPAVALERATVLCLEKYGISHTTIQVEAPFDHDKQDNFVCSNTLHKQAFCKQNIGRLNQVVWVSVL